MAWCITNVLLVVGFAMPFWPAAGFALAMALRRGRAVLVGIAVGSLLANLLLSATLHQPITGSLVLRLGVVGAGAAAQASVGAWLVRRFASSDGRLVEAREIFGLLLLGGALASLLNATVGTAALSAEHLMNASSLAERWVTWWLGDTAGVFLVAPLTLAVLDRHRLTWSGRVGAVAAGLLATALVLGVLMRLALDRNDAQLRADLGRLAQARQARLALSVDHAQQLVRACATYVRGTDDLDAQRFRDFVRRPLQDNPALHAVGWNPLLDPSGRRDLERTTAVHVRERDPEGRLVPAGDREFYAPVRFIEPIAGNHAAIGYDVASEETRRSALQFARATGDLAVSGPVRLVQETSDQFGVLLFAPATDASENTRGFAVAVFRLRELLREVMAGQGVPFAARLTDVTGGVATPLASVRASSADWDSSLRPWVSKLAVGGRVWQLELALTDDQAQRRRAVVSGGTVGVGVLLAGLMAALVLLLSGRGDHERRQLHALAEVNDALQDEIRERERAEEDVRRVAAEAAHQASHDPVTGLVNRREFERLTDRLTELAQTTGGTHALAFIDLDQFKVVNDTAGHGAGDDVLRQVAGLLLSHVRSTDTLARLGGDEFGLLLPDCTLDRARATAQRLVDSLAHHRFLCDDRTFSIGASVGLVRVTVDSGGTSTLLAQADVACYAAKEAGRGRVRVYAGDDDSARERHAEILTAADLRRAIDQGRLRLVRQPIRSLGTASAEAQQYEVLVRMELADGRLALPCTFIPAAERFGLMLDLDRWVVSHALTAVASWPASESIAINLSGLSLADLPLQRFIRERLAALHIGSGRVCFEITETAAIRNLPAALAFIEQLRRAGCVFALDDFGSGMSSFGYLKNLPVDYLKIDAFFVRDLEDPTHEIMVRAIHELARALGIGTVAEGAETDELVARLRAIGVDRAQGWALGRPTALPGEPPLATS